MLKNNAVGFPLTEFIRKLGPPPLGNGLTYSALVVDRNGRLLHLFSCFWASLYIWVNPFCRLRMERARQMLASERTVTDVCFEVGYESLGSFSAKFHAQFGRSPIAFQREVRRIFGYHAPWRVLKVPECFLHAWARIE